MRGVFNQNGQAPHHRLIKVYFSVPGVLHQGLGKSLGLVIIKTVIIINHNDGNDSKKNRKQVCVSGTLLGFSHLLFLILKAKLCFHYVRLYIKGKKVTIYGLQSTFL